MWSRGRLRININVSSIEEEELLKWANNAKLKWVAFYKGVEQIFDIVPYSTSSVPLQYLRNLLVMVLGISWCSFLRVSFSPVAYLARNCSTIGNYYFSIVTTLRGPVQRDITEITEREHIQAPGRIWTQDLSVFRLLGRRSNHCATSAAVSRHIIEKIERVKKAQDPAGFEPMTHAGRLVLQLSYNRRAKYL